MRKKTDKKEVEEKSIFEENLNKNLENIMKSLKESVFVLVSVLSRNALEKSFTPNLFILRVFNVASGASVNFPLRRVCSELL